MEPISFTDEDVTELNEILFDDEEIAIQPINLEHVFANEENSETSDSDSDSDDSDSDDSDSDSDSDNSELAEMYEESLLEDVYFPTLTIVQLENLAASAYHDRNPSKLSAILDPIALDHDVTSDSIKNELISFHKDMNNGLWVNQKTNKKQITIKPIKTPLFFNNPFLRFITHFSFALFSPFSGTFACDSPSTLSFHPSWCDGSVSATSSTHKT